MYLLYHIIATCQRPGGPLLLNECRPMYCQDFNRVYCTIDEQLIQYPTSSTLHRPICQYIHHVIETLVNNIDSSTIYNTQGPGRNLI